MLTNQISVVQKYVLPFFYCGQHAVKPTEGSIPHERTQPGKGKTPMRIPSALVIEDNEYLADVFATALQKAGFETQIIGAGDAALIQLSTATPDLVILDLNLPRVSGAQILRHIRADARLAGTRVIVATAYPNMAQELREEADLVLLKPVSFTQLRDLAMRFGPIMP